ncbi:hypothetical protein FOQG_17580 [Fusarium oxysporum f. sp. raphani 54005]|uniref:DUF5672 domain-containing protein n=2 Tax=Fusarium oxysporum f. sp. raphani TaxID=96318 RepID=X0B6I4_FUSOX|nr:hypothetical protein FOQG_17580 [Fusarium oxysporum f. sp. raphani 54005]KAG7420569.1 hypothetical protein Forpi1262_v016163 [Fusarium oxysporum f. sp. raphani]
MTRPRIDLSQWADLPVVATTHLKRRFPTSISRGVIFAISSLVLTWTIATVVLPHYQPAIASQIDNARENLPSVSIDWSPNHDPRKNYNASKVALIIEPEPLPVLVPLILHMIAVVPPDWRFIFIGSKKSIFTVGREYGIQLQQGLGKIDLVRLPSPWSIKRDEDRSRLLTDTRFYNEFLPGVEYLLMFNYESILCANANVSLNDWLGYSWAGAGKADVGQFAGWGKLSLRRVSAIQQVLGFQKRYNDSDPEDRWFGKRLYLLPDAKAANAIDPPFAVTNYIRPNPMGYYMPDRGRGLDREVWKVEKHRKAVLQYCPELHIILDMRLERERCGGDNRMGEIVGQPTEAGALPLTTGPA